MDSHLLGVYRLVRDKHFGKKTKKQKKQSDLHNKGSSHRNVLGVTETERQVKSRNVSSSRPPEQLQVAHKKI